MAKPDIRSCELTYDDYLLFPDDGKRHEIIDGDHYMTPAPRIKHQAVSINISTALKNFVENNGLGVVFTAPCDVILSDDNVVQPDIIIISAARVGILTEENVQGAPDLVVEILSESTRKKDEVTKRKLYERFGVQEYWIIDPELEMVKIFRRAQQRFAQAVELNKEAGDVVSTEVLTGFELPLTKIFK